MSWNPFLRATTPSGLDQVGDNGASILGSQSSIPALLPGRIKSIRTPACSKMSNFHRFYVGDSSAGQIEDPDAKYTVIASHKLTVFEFERNTSRNNKRSFFVSVEYDDSCLGIIKSTRNFHER